MLGGSSVLALAADSGTNMSIVIQRMLFRNRKLYSAGNSVLRSCRKPDELRRYFPPSGKFMQQLPGSYPGGLAMVAVATCAFFAAISGSSAATAAAVGAIIVPEMLKHKYDRNFAAGTIASSAELGVIIPPSIGLIQYGVAAEQSIGDLFKAGFLPGLFICGTIMAMAHHLAKKQGFVPVEKASWAERGKAFKDAILAILMPVIILGGIYSGFFTPTEAAVVSVFYGLVVGVFVYREIKLKDLKKIFYESVLTMATVLLIMSASTIFGWILAKQQIPQALAKAFLGISDSKYVFLLLINVMLLVVGMVCEAGAAMVILAPLLAPIAQTLGIDLIHFGIIMMTNLAIGMMTPPVGVNLYVVCDSANVKIEGHDEVPDEVFRGSDCGSSYYYIFSAAVFTDSNIAEIRRNSS